MRSDFSYWFGLSEKPYASTVQALHLLNIAIHCLLDRMLVHPEQDGKFEFAI